MALRELQLELWGWCDMRQRDGYRTSRNGWAGNLVNSPLERRPYRDEPLPVLPFKQPQSLQPWQALAERLLQHPEILIQSARIDEVDFLTNMRRSRTAPTAAQEKWMRDIDARRRERARTA